jgi:hypothetical protein
VKKFENIKKKTSATLHLVVVGFSIYFEEIEGFFGLCIRKIV